MDYWARAGVDRHQTLLMYPTLDESVSDDHPVRLLDEILRARDWSAWECAYHGGRGQPPIPPWVMAGAILYGLMRRIRSSRQLEYACRHNMDFLWLVEGRSIDHDTFCRFRTRFQEPLRKLFREIGRVAMSLGLIELVEVAFDGTRVKANASRFHTWTAKKVEDLLEALEAEVGRLLREAEAADAAESATWRPEGRKLPAELADAQKRREKLREALQKLREADAARKRDGTDPQKSPTQLAPADLDAKVMPNKEGGYAPNYTPTVAVDGAAGVLVDCNVIDTPKENQELPDSMERTERAFEKQPEKLLVDAGIGTVANLEEMERRGIDFYTPMESPLPAEGNPARRADPQQAVAAEDWARLPRDGRKKLAKSCFVYDEQADQYYCPMGKLMRYVETQTRDRAGGTAKLRVYRCPQCAGCALASECLDVKAQRGRTVSRDGAEPLRAKMSAKRASESGRTIYHRRMHVAETPFALLKGVLGVRQFLLRGLSKVRTEWLWVCTAYNLRKLISAVAVLRAAARRNPEMTET
jgi:transposase